MDFLGRYPATRMRRNRRDDWNRRLVAENTLSAADFILPIFVAEGQGLRQPVASMPGVDRVSVDLLSEVVA
ncbi:MAG: porphobilinogen synthase, partial [Rhodospirillaceae bacterium]|nr:porphobilinogen synthase [Rhodospirillaceae bacterium]